jgi:hypothetical protein
LDAKSQYSKSRSSGYVGIPKNVACFGPLNLPNVEYIVIATYSLDGMEHFNVPRLKVLDLRGSDFSSTEVEKNKRKFGPKVMILGNTANDDDGETHAP